jgi:hypothetical protein
LSWIIAGALSSCNSAGLQTLFADEVVTNSCAVPENRGASSTDRSTWDGKRTSTSASDGTACDETFDASIEEILHLINSAGTSYLYPDQWDGVYSSSVGGYLESLNGNCGNGYSGDFVDPLDRPNECSYAYRDETCDEGCIVIEGIYWAVTSYIGAQYYSGSRANGEWNLAVPDTGMTNDYGTL